MNLSRRDLLASVGGLIAATAMRTVSARIPEPPAGDATSGLLPAKGDFAIPDGQTYINSAFIHPLPVFAADAAKRYLDTRALREERRRSGNDVATEVKAEFAKMINARPSEISLVQNTSSGENLVVNGLGIPANEGNVVTDALHFEGSLVLYGELQKRGLDVRVVQPRDWRITMSDMEQVVNRKTQLIAVSLVSWYNGFEHDLKAVCDLAHAHGAYVYADVIQGVGNTPIDVRALGLDFCACSTYKWLMGDFGIGFLYAREELLDTVVKRTVYGYQQADIAFHYLPTDPPGPSPLSWQLKSDASAHFEVGTFSQSGIHALSQSLPYLNRIGPEKIQAHRQPLLKRLQVELPRLGFTSLTPPETKSALISFFRKDLKQQYGDRLQKAKVSVTLADHRMRIAPSLFNDQRDIDTLLNALS